MEPATYADLHFAAVGVLFMITPLLMLISGKWPSARTCVYQATLIASLSIPSAIMGIWLNLTACLLSSTLWYAVAFASYRETRLASTAE